MADRGVVQIGKGQYGNIGSTRIRNTSIVVKPLSKNFQFFFSRLNPGPSFEQKASSQHNTIRGLIEDRNGLAAELEPVTFLQGSYRQQTAIYNINDVDIVVLCKLWYPGSGGGGGGLQGGVRFQVILPHLP